MITIQINGEKKTVPEGSLQDLIDHLKLRKEWTLIELNSQAIDRNNLDHTPVRQDDTVEVIRAVAGG